MPCGPACACLDSGVECLAVVSPDRFGFFAEWCAGDDMLKRAHVLARSRVGLDPAPPAEEAPRPDVAGQLRLLARMKQCEHWLKASDCGCGNNRCALGKGRAGVVSHADCLACLAPTAGVD